MNGHIDSDYGARYRASAADPRLAHHPVAFAKDDGTWTVTNGEAAPFVGGDEWASGPGVRMVTGDFH